VCRHLIICLRGHVWTIGEVYFMLWDARDSRYVNRNPIHVSRYVIFLSGSPPLELCVWNCDTGVPMPAFQYRIPNSRLIFPAFQCRHRNTGNPMPVPRFAVIDYRIPISSTPIPEFYYRYSISRLRIPGIAIPEMEYRNWRSWVPTGIGV